LLLNREHKQRTPGPRANIEFLGSPGEADEMLVQQINGLAEKTKISLPPQKSRCGKCEMRLANRR